MNYCILIPFNKKLRKLPNVEGIKSSGKKFKSFVKIQNLGSFENRCKLVFSIFAKSENDVKMIQKCANFREILFCENFRYREHFCFRKNFRFQEVFAKMATFLR
jgi:hypothetical protein